MALLKCGQRERRGKGKVTRSNVTSHFDRKTNFNYIDNKVIRKKSGKKITRYRKICKTGGECLQEMSRSAKGRQTYIIVRTSV